MTTTDPLLRMRLGPRELDMDRAVQLGLTHRHAQILLYVAAGFTNAQIGAQLYLAPNTVHTHLCRASEAVKVWGRVSLVDWAWRQGIFRALPEVAS